MIQTNDDQAEFWTSDAGRTWVALQDALDATFAPVLAGVLNRANLSPGQSVLDIGCGTGASTLRAAKIVGPHGMAVGADISPTMLESAQTRATGLENVAFVEADASCHAFEPAVFDHMISRFGVMFFAQPIIAFTNIIRGLKPGAKVTFASWGQIANNPWFTVAAGAAKAQLGAPPSVDPDAPGPFAFRDATRVCDMLRTAGLKEVSVDIVSLALEPNGTAKEVAKLASSIGPASRTLAHFDGTKDDQSAIIDGIQAGFQDFETPEGVRVPAEINFFQATAPTS